MEPNKEPARSEPVVSVPDLRLKELETENKRLKDHIVEMVMRPDARLKELETENKRLRDQLVEVHSVRTLASKNWIRRTSD